MVMFVVDPYPTLWYGIRIVRIVFLKASQLDRGVRSSAWRSQLISDRSTSTEVVTYERAKQARVISTES